MANNALHFERSSDQALTYLRITGTIDESFNGTAAAGRVQSDVERIVINLSGINLITSFGIRGWGEMISDLERRKVDVYYVECSPKFVTELNQVVYFASQGHVVSCYAPYLCPECGTNRQVLLRLDRDQEAIRRRQPPDYECMVCGGRLEFDEDPASYFPGLEAHLDQPINKDVMAFLEARLGYEGEHERQLQIQKVVVDKTTVLNLNGTLDQSLDGPSLAQGLEGEVVVDMSGILHVQRAGLRAWSEFLHDAAPRASRIWIVASPTLVIERAADGTGADFTRVISVQIPYHCTACDSTEFAELSLAGKEGERVRAGEPPERKCSSCHKSVRAMVGTGLLGRMQALPEPVVPSSVTKAQKKASKQIEAARKAARARLSRGGRSRPMPWVAVMAGVLVLGGGLAALGATMLLRSTKTVENTPTTQPNNPTQQPGPGHDRPDWITGDVASASYCTDVGRQLYCVGVSSYQSTRELAEKEGFQAAVEAFSHFALLNESDAAIVQQRATYLKSRTEATRALEQAQLEKSKRLPEVLASIRDKRARAVELLKRQSAPGAPARRAAWHWEEYKKEVGEGTEFLAFVRVDVSDTELKAFTNHYRSALSLDGASIQPLIPGMAWVLDPTGKVGYFGAASASQGKLKSAGFKEGDVLMIESDAAPSPAELKTAVGSGKGVSIRKASDYSKESQL